MRTELRVPLLALTAWVLGASASASSLEEVKHQGRLRIAVYTDFAPFSDDGKGIDVDVGKALAHKVGVEAEIMTFKDADSVDDDLRNVVWKGHFLWNQQLADVMMHVPVHPYLASKNQQVRIFAPYYHDRIVLARNRNRIPQLATLEVFAREKIGAQSASVEDSYLSNAFGGLLRQNVVHYGTMAEAAAALRKNEVPAVMGRQTDLEAGLGEAAASFIIAPIAMPGLPLYGWDVGIAVKADSADLATALEEAMTDLRANGTIERIFTKRGLTYAPPGPARSQ